MKAKSKSYITSAKTMFAAMSILSKNGGTMPIRILMQEIEKAVELSAWEKETLENTGNIRWQSNMHFTSVDYVRAGFLIKKKGNWTITPEGEEALKLGAEKLRDEAYVTGTEARCYTVVPSGSDSRSQARSHLLRGKEGLLNVSPQDK